MRRGFAAMSSAVLAAWLAAALALPAAAGLPQSGMDAVAAILRDLIATKMTPAQIAEAQKLAREWAPKPEKK
jgi:anti-sigma factor RsiW